MSPSLGNQVSRQWAGAGPDVVPGRLLALFFRPDVPSGEGDPARPLSQPAWSAVYWLLENAALEPDVVPMLSSFERHTRDVRPDGEVPIAIASFRVAVPSDGLLRSVRAAAAQRRALRFDAGGLEERRVFAATGFLHGQWQKPIPTHRGRDVTFVLDRELYLTNPGGPEPKRVEARVDGGDWKPLKFGDRFGPCAAAGDEVVVWLRCDYGDDVRTAAFSVAVSDDAAPSAPDRTWELEASGGTASGCAWVFLAPRHAKLVNPVIMVEGFPGGRAYDYTYEVLNQNGMVDALHRNGYDLVIVGLENGLLPIKQNAGVLEACMRRVREETPRPLVVGGLSMGGLISRYVLARMESSGQPHGTRAYLSIDAPHRGTYTSLGVQWFVQSLVPIAPALRGFAGLLDSPANQELLLWWLDDGEAVESRLRTAFKEDLRKLGHPMQPRKLGVACGRGDGGGGNSAGAPALDWDGDAITMKIHMLPGEGGLLAEGSWLGGELRPLQAPRGEPAWDAAPGGLNSYNGEMSAFAANLGCGEVTPGPARTCGVPTVSALDLDQHPFEPVPPGSGPFDAYTCNTAPAQHLEMSVEVTDWIVGQLGPPPAPPAGARPWNPYAFDPYDPAFIKSPYETYERFREHERHFFVPRFKSRWFFEYDACRKILADRTRFLTNHPDGGERTPGPLGILREFPTTVFSADPPRHTDLREVFEPAFGSQIGRAKANAEERAQRILDRVAETGHMELVWDYAIPVPANVLFDIMGIPDNPLVRTGILQWAALIIASHDSRQPDTFRFQGGTAKMALQAYLEGLLRQYERGQPPQGLIGRLAYARGDLGADDVYATCLEFVVAGYLSTTWLVASAILTLSEQKQFPAVRRPGVDIDAVVCEILRLEPPVQIIDRFAAEDTRLAGVRLRRGDKVTAVIASANRDARFADPDTFKLDRPNADEHLSFGAGIHRCIGKPLAEVVAPVLLSKLLSLGEPAVAGEPQWQTDPYLRGVLSLPLTF